MTVFRTFIISLLFFSTPLWAQDNVISGYVLSADTERPLSSASVRLIDRSGAIITTSMTNNRGYYTLRTDSTGYLSVAVVAEGYQRAQDNAVQLDAGQALLLNFTLVAAAQIEEVVVIARPQVAIGEGAISARVLTREEIRRATGTAGDIFRGLSSLPGVASTGAFSNFTVRGRGPRDNLILIDGIPYDRAVHFDQTLGEEEDIGGGGRFSIFGQEVVGSATFKPGGWSPEYAGAGGGLLAINLAEGNLEKANIRAKLDLAGGELLYDGPSGLNDNTSMLISARYYDFGQLFNIIGQNEIGRPVLSNLLLKTTTRYDDGSSLKFLALYTPEKYERNLENALAGDFPDDPLLLDTEQDAGLMALTWDKTLGSNARWSNSIYFRFAEDISSQGEAWFDQNTDFSDPSVIAIEENIISVREKENEFGWRSDLKVFNGLGQLYAGLHVARWDVDYGQALARDYALLTYDQNDFRPDMSVNYIQLTPGNFNASLDVRANRLAGYLGQRFDRGDASLYAGVRVDHDSLIDSTTVSPRLELGIDANARLKFKINAGVYYQSPRLLDIAADPLNIALKPEKITTLSLGARYILRENLELISEVYYQDLEDMIPESDRVTGVKNNNGSGRAYGFDVALNRSFKGGWSGSVRYGYNNSLLDDGDGSPKHPSAFNRPHVFNAALSKEFGSKWSLGMQYQMASGRPAEAYTVHAVTLPLSGLQQFSREITDRYDGRYRNYSTLNLRVDYRTNIGKSNLNVFFDVINVMARKNVDAVDFSRITGDISTDNFGVFPQFGLSIKY